MTSVVETGIVTPISGASVITFMSEVTCDYPPVTSVHVLLLRFVKTILPYARGGCQALEPKTFRANEDNLRSITDISDLTLDRL